VRGPSARILDAGHNGHSHFFFLPPIVPQPTFTGAFSPDVSPTVEIARLGVNGCTAGTVRTFSGSQVQVSLTDEHYLVSWRTDLDNLDPLCTYRIRVLLGVTELGFADVDVVNAGRELKNVNTNEFIPLLDDRTLPIKFRVEVGGCGTGADCGEGTALPGENTTIVTESGDAGIFIPAGAVDQPVTIIIESVDNRPCIPGLVGQTFEGRPGAAANSCYEFRTDPPLSEITETGRFNTPVIVGICVDLAPLTPAQRLKLQIFQFHAGASPELRPLPNVPAPFLECDPQVPGTIGLRKGGLLDLAGRSLRSLVRPLASLVSPQPLFATTRMMTFDLGAGGATDFLSTFTWGLVTTMAKNAGDGQSAIVGNPVAIPPSVIFTDSTGAPVDSVPVTFSVGSGGGTVTGASVLSGPDGVATVGSWTLGATPGTNTLIASAPAGSAVVNSPQTFTASGVVPVTLIDCGAGVGGDQIDRGFYVPSFPGTRLDRVTLYLSARTADTYTVSLTARSGAYDGAVLGTASATVALTANDQASVATTFTFPSPAIRDPLVTFTIARTGGAAADLFYAVPGALPTGDPSCPVVETEGTTPPLDTFRRQGVHVKIEGGTFVIP
jgi:hypothetical protein